MFGADSFTKLQAASQQSNYIYPAATISAVLLICVAFTTSQWPYFKALDNNFLHSTHLCCLYNLSRALFHSPRQQFPPSYSFMLLFILLRYLSQLINPDKSVDDLLSSALNLKLSDVCIFSP